MGQAQDKARELRAKLAKAEKAAQTEAAQARAERKAAQRTKDEADTDAFREANFDITVGDYSRYLGISFYGSEVSITFAEWTITEGTVTLDEDKAQQLIDAVQANMA